MLALLVGACIASTAPGVARAADPLATYHTLKHGHFNIHYASGLDHLAYRALHALDRANELVTSILGWQVEGTVHVRIEDVQDSANGLASSHQRPFILLYAAPPDIDSALQYHDDWIRTLALHEFTHVVHLQMQHGLARAFNTVFGDLWLPNAMVPRWFIEGLAVLLESRLTNRGRVFSPYYQALVRTHALEGTFYSLDRMSHTLWNYPGGTAEYAYGALFLDYVARRFGMGAIAAWCHQYARQPIPYAFNAAFARSTGVSLVAAWRDWRDDMVRRARRFVAQRGAQLPEGARRVTTDGYTKGTLAWTTDGILFSRSGKSLPGIYRWQPDRGETLVVRGSGGSAFATAGDTLLYVRSASQHDAYRMGELFAASMAQRKPTPHRLTWGMRARDVATDRTGDTVVLTSIRGGKTSVWVRRGTAPFAVLIPEKEDVHFYHPVLTADGRTAYAVRRTGAQVDVVRIDTQTGALRLLWRDSAIEKSLSLSPDGRRLAYVSDADGTDNAYIVDLATGRRAKVTNVPTAVGAVTWSPSGDALAVTILSRIGWDLHTMPLPTRLDWSDAPVTTDSPQVASRPPAPHPAPAPYDPLPSLAPTAWRLRAALTGATKDIAAAVSATDAVGLHHVDAEVGLDVASRDSRVALSYSYAGAIPSLGVAGSFTRLHTVPTDEDTDPPHTDDAFTLSAVVSFPWLGLDETARLSLRYLTVHRRTRYPAVPLDPNGDLPPLSTDRFDAGIAATWRIQDTYAGPWAVSIERGRIVWMDVLAYHRALGGSRDWARFAAGWQRYVPLGDNRVLALQLRGGMALTPDGVQNAFSAGGYAPQDLVTALWSNTPFGQPGVRGFSPRTFRGSHYAAGRIEFRFPLWAPQRGYHTVPLFFRRVYATAFTDGMWMSNGPPRWRDAACGVGAELVWQLYAAYYLPITVRTGYARGIGPQGINEWFLVMGNAF